VKSSLRREGFNNFNPALGSDHLIPLSGEKKSDVAFIQNQKIGFADRCYGNQKINQGSYQRSS